MATGKNTFPTMHPVAGFQLGTTSAGIKVAGRKDVVVMKIADGSSVAGVFTQNRFCAAPVHITKQHMQQTTPNYFLINTGNANAGTGEQGMVDSLSCCQAVADAANVAPHEVLPFSTGVIGEPLPVDLICHAVPAALDQLSEHGWADAAEGILTTDTCPKGCID
jgi:glutamate N-acetyltransferase/amino-acid N-acetyltransferase